MSAGARRRKPDVRGHFSGLILNLQVAESLAPGWILRVQVLYASSLRLLERLSVNTIRGDAVRTREVVIVDRDSKHTQIYRLADDALVSLQADGAGWIMAETMKVRFRRIDTQPRRVRIEDVVDPVLRAEI